MRSYRESSCTATVLPRGGGSAVMATPWERMLSKNAGTSYMSLHVTQKAGVLACEEGNPWDCMVLRKANTNNTLHSSCTTQHITGGDRGDGSGTAARQGEERERQWHGSMDSGWAGGMGVARKEVPEGRDWQG
jgi:hypothetical protein